MLRPSTQEAVIDLSSRSGSPGNAGLETLGRREMPDLRPYSLRSCSTASQANQGKTHCHNEGCLYAAPLRSEPSVQSDLLQSPPLLGADKIQAGEMLRMSADVVMMLAH